MQTPTIPLQLHAGAQAQLQGEVRPAGEDALAPGEPAFAQLLEAGLSALAVNGVQGLASGAAAAVTEEPPATDAAPGGADLPGAGGNAVAMVLAAIGLPAGRAPGGATPGATTQAGDAHVDSISTGMAARPGALSDGLLPRGTAAASAAATGSFGQALRAAQGETLATPIEAQNPAAPAGTSLTAADPRMHAAPAPAAPPELRAPVGAADWDADLGHALRWMTSEKLSVAELRLNPPDLGPLEIRLVLGGEDGNTANLSFVSQHAAVREAIQNAMPHLREMLAESGISLGQAGVNAESNRGAGERNGSGPGDPSGTGENTDMRAAALPAAALRTGAGLVDTFA